MRLGQRDRFRARRSTGDYDIRTLSGVDGVPIEFDMGASGDSFLGAEPPHMKESMRILKILPTSCINVTNNGLFKIFLQFGIGQKTS